jgi:hypothetical protein
MSTQSARSYIFLHGSSEPPSDDHRRSAAARANRPGLDVSGLLPRSVRIERKVELARQRLDAIAASARDVRRPLLCLAVLRRDEALVDGILVSLDAERQRALFVHDDEHEGGKLEFCGGVAG